MIQVITNAAAKRAEILIYDAIGPDLFGDGSTVGAKKLSQELTQAGELSEIVIKINSPGGDVWDGLAIYNTLAKHPARKIVEIEGLAASAASFIAMVGDEIRMSENALMMIHLAQGMTFGDRNEHAKQIEVLSKHDDRIAETYAARSGKEASYFMDLMTVETWMSAEEAVGHGLVTAVIPSKRIAACAGPECAKRFGFKNMPEAAKRFFSKTAATVGTTSKEIPVMGKKNAKCGCGNRKENLGRKRNGASYASLMNGSIDAAVTEERTKEVILQELADAADVELADVEGLLADEGGCPSMEHIDAFAGVEGMPGAEAQKSSAMDDGCEYEEKPAEGGEESPGNAFECPACSGTGNCEKCNGTGSIDKPFDCVLCDGTGDCMFCAGTGMRDSVDDAVAAKLAKIAADGAKEKPTKPEGEETAVENATCPECNGYGKCIYCQGTGVLPEPFDDKCNWCNGSGVCKECDGTGKTVRDDVSNEEFDCLSCDGTGVMEDGEECTVCGGTGKIEEPDAVEARLNQIAADSVKLRMAEIEA